MNCILFGGSGEVGGAVARELLKSDVCSKLTMLGRRILDSMQDEAMVDQVIVDTSSSDFEAIVKEIAQGHDIGISCIGIGSGTAWMSEEQMIEVEVNMLGKTRFIPDSVGWGNIRQEEVAQAFVAHLEKRVAMQKKPVVSYGNKEMKFLISE